MKAISNFLFFNGATATGTSNIANNTNSDTLSVQVEGTFAGTIAIEGRSDRTNGSWVSLAGINLNDFSVAANGLTAAGLYEFGVEGITEIRAEITAYTSGAISVFGKFVNTGV